AIPAGLVAADRLEALAPEELERPRHFLNAGEAIVVPGAWLPRLLALVGAGHAEPRVLGELAQEVFDVVWLERHVRVEIADELVGNMLDPRGPRVERMHLAGEVTLLPLGHPHQLDPLVGGRMAPGDLVRPVGRPVADDHPLGGPECLPDDGLDGLLEVE